MIALLMFTVWFFGAGLWSMAILPKGGKVRQNGESIFCHFAWIGWALAQTLFLGWITTLNWNSPEFSANQGQIALVLGLMMFDLIWGKASSQIWMNIIAGFKGMIVNVFENIFFIEPPSKVARRQEEAKRLAEEW